MSHRNRTGAVLLGVLFLAGCAENRVPAQNISPTRHPYLAAAQRLCGDAFQRVTRAQDANEWDLNGHAQRAKNLLVQASDELKQAALASNSRRGD